VLRSEPVLAEARLAGNRRSVQIRIRLRALIILYILRCDDVGQGVDGLGLAFDCFSEAREGLGEVIHGWMTRRLTRRIHLKL